MEPVQSRIWYCLHWLSEHPKRRIHSGNNTTNQESRVRAVANAQLWNIFIWSVCLVLVQPLGRGWTTFPHGQWFWLVRKSRTPAPLLFPVPHVLPWKESPSLSFWSTCSQTSGPPYVGYLETQRQWAGAQHTVMFSVMWDPCGCFHSICSELEGTGLPRWLGGKALACSADSGLIPGLGRSPGKGKEGNGSPLQYSCLEDPHGQRSLAGCSPWGRKELDTTER